MVEYIIIATLIIGLSALGYFFIKIRSEVLNLREKYDPIIKMDEELEKRNLRIEQLKRDAQEFEETHEQRKGELTREYTKYKSIYDHLKAELRILEENLEMTSFGLYEPHYDFDTSEQYKRELTIQRTLQKALIKNEKAAVCEIQWQVDGSVAKGRRQTKELIRLLLRAFNNESDAAMLKVKWNNVNQMEQRLIKAHEAINKLGTTQRTYITDDYLKLKLNELYLTHEYHEKRHEEQEEQRRIREQIRDEERAQKELDKAQKEAEAEERRYATALEKAKKDVSQAQGKKLDKLNEQIAKLEQQLVEAQTQKERAVSRAQLTKSGFVYVISNLGSFGENIYKIGMTRRLEPMDRVRELGDASVPFQFDVHAMIDSNNAPELENRLHKLFEKKRVNLVNTRREFFYVTLEEIEKAVHDNHGEIEFTKLAEAREFRQSETMRAEFDKEAQNIEVEEEFPETLVTA